MMKRGKIVFFDATSSRRQRLSSSARNPRPAATPATKEKVVVCEEVVPPAPKTFEQPEEAVKEVPNIHAEPVSPEAPTKSELESYLINFVVEQTGYPEDMVDMDADLEGDLGIDSIKKAQLLGELNEMFHFSVEADRQNMSLDDFPTLGAIRDFMCKRLGSEPSAETEAKALPSSDAESVSPEAPTKSELESYLINFVVEQTGYPEDMVDMDADLANDLGIDSIKKAQLFGAIGEVVGFFPLEEASLGDFLTLRQILNGTLKYKEIR